MSEWRPTRLGNVTDLLTGYSFQSDRYTDDPDDPRLLRGDNVAQGVLRWDGAKRWPSEGVDGLSRYELDEGDVVLAMDRPWIEAGLKYASVRTSDLPAFLVQRVARLRGTSELNTGFLKCLVGSRSFTEYVLSVQTGTAVPHISGDQIRDFEFLLPPVSEQRTIAHILGTLDDKIELNRRMNETLEAMAQALFKSWFVNFEPVRAKMEGRWRRGESLPGLPAHLYELFPDRLVDSELGEIPEGWGICSLRDIATNLRGVESPGHAPNALFQHFSIPAYDKGQQPRPEYGREIRSQKSVVPREAILLSKLNPRIERVWLTDVHQSGRPICSTEFVVLVPHAGCPRSYLYCLLTSRGFREQLLSLVTGTSGSHQRAPVKAILDIATSRASTPVTNSFDILTSPQLNRILMNRRESHTLMALRDTLLPKFISGEIRVSEMNRSDLGEDSIASELP